MSAACTTRHIIILICMPPVYLLYNTGYEPIIMMMMMMIKIILIAYMVIGLREIYSKFATVDLSVVGGSVGAKMIFLHKRECITLLYSPTNDKKKLKLVES